MNSRSLNKLLEASDKVLIDNTSKIVILSDVHRGDGSYADSLIANKNIYVAALNFYYKEGYTLIEAGDGDELWKNSSYLDIAYNYKDVFKIYNKFNNDKRIHLLFGNHDSKKRKKEYMEKQIKKLKKIDKSFGNDFIYLAENIDFKEAITLKHTPTNKEMYITHGHQLDFMNYEFAPYSKFLVRHLWRYLEGIAGFKAPTSPATNYKKGGVVDRKLTQFSRDYSKFIICGHTHISRFPALGEGLYFNDGCCVLPYSISTIEISSGLIALVKWFIDVREDNSLYIRRRILSGPEKIEEYLKVTDKRGEWEKK